MLIPRIHARKAVLIGLASSALPAFVLALWLNVRTQPYPRGVQFRAPHQAALLALIDAVWFRPDAPLTLGRLPKSWIPVVYAQSCSTPLCNGTTGEETNVGCPNCGSGYNWQNCVPSVQSAYCSQSINSCGCQRATNSKCNPIN
jgi:hypothetical protein